jgi:prepilin-type N-terminal cleavage/methylation domain-containing protein
MKHIYEYSACGLRIRCNSVSGFTIVELLVVIVVIGILASITIVSYSGITNKASASVIQSDLNNASKQLKMYYATHGSYPTALDSNYCPTSPFSNSDFCLKVSGSNSLSYNGSTETFSLSGTDGNTYYKLSDNSTPAESDKLSYGLIGYWPLDENTSTTTADSSQASITHNGTLAGTTLPSWTTGVSGSALSFDGSSSNVIMGNYTYNFYNQACSMSAWFYSNATTGRRTIFSLGNASGVSIQLEIGFGGPAGGGSYEVALNVSGSGKAQSVNNVYTNNTWNHIVYTKDNSGQHIYVNGSEVSLVMNNSYTLTDNAISTKYIGQRGSSSQYFQGYIDEVRLYDRVLSLEEINMLHNI